MKKIPPEAIRPQAPPATNPRCRLAASLLAEGGEQRVETARGKANHSWGELRRGPPRLFGENSEKDAGIPRGGLELS